MIKSRFYPLHRPSSIEEGFNIGIPRHILTRVYSSVTNIKAWFGNKSVYLRTHNKFEHGKYYLIRQKYSGYSLIMKFEHEDNNIFFSKDWRKSLDESLVKAGESAPMLISSELERQAWLWQVYRFNNDEDALHYRMLMELRR